MHEEQYGPCGRLNDNLAVHPTERFRVYLIVQCKRMHHPASSAIATATIMMATLSATVAVASAFGRGVAKSAGCDPEFPLVLMGNGAGQDLKALE